LRDNLGTTNTTTGLTTSEVLNGHTTVRVDLEGAAREGTTMRAIVTSKRTFRPIFSRIRGMEW
jgi:hypothetical protein